MSENVFNWKLLRLSQKPIKSGFVEKAQLSCIILPAAVLSCGWRDQKRGFVKARPPCATATECSSSLQCYPFQVHFLPHTPYPVLFCFVLFLLFMNCYSSVVTRYVRSASSPGLCCNISILCSSLWITMRIRDNMFRDCSVALHYQTSERIHKPAHTSFGVCFHVLS